MGSSGWCSTASCQIVTEVSYAASRRTVMKLNARSNVIIATADRRALPDGQRVDMSRYPPTMATVTMPANGRYILRSAATIFGSGTTSVGARTNTTAAATKRTAGRGHTRASVAAATIVTAANQGHASSNVRRYIGA